MSVVDVVGVEPVDVELDVVDVDVDVEVELVVDVVVTSGTQLADSETCVRSSELDGTPSASSASARACGLVVSPSGTETPW